MTPLTWDALRSLVSRALEQGATRHSLVATEWDISGDCLHPKTIEHFARPGDARKFLYPGKGRHSLSLVMHVRCRQCERCIRLRRHEWIRRALREVQVADRTWLVTLTMRPEEHYRLLVQAQKNKRDISTETARLQAELAEAGREATLYLKRLRKESGSRLRYLLIAEQHKSGLPHYHMLIHERSGCVKHATLQGQWHLGFSHAKLLEDVNGARYVAKYLMKCKGLRVRASLHYGHDTPSGIVEQSRNVIK